MSQHIFKTLRQFVICNMLKALPLHPVPLATPEPKRAPETPESDVWMFESERSIPDHVADLGHAMRDVSVMLGSLRHVVSLAARAEPELATREDAAPAFGVVWSDAMLFDGEPQPVDADRPALAGEMDFLFEDIAPARGIDKVIWGQNGGAGEQALHASL